MSETAAPALYRRDGEFLVVRDGVVLPARCVRTNQPVEANDWLKNKRITGLPDWVQALGSVLMFTLFLGWLLWGDKANFRYLGAFTLLVTFCVVAAQKRGRVTYGVSSQVRKFRRRKLLYAAIWVVLGVALYVLKWNEVCSVPAVVFPVLGWVSYMTAAPVLAPLRVARYRDGEFWLERASTAFLDSLEEP